MPPRTEKSPVTVMRRGKVVGNVRTADVTREEIAEHVWSQEFDPFSNLIEVYINRLRRHMEKITSKKLIHTIRGSGYILEEQAQNHR